jgi:fibronectin type 3 domain-containing protein
MRKPLHYLFLIATLHYGAQLRGEVQTFGSDAVLAEFAGKCARFVIVPRAKLSPVGAIIKKAGGYSVLRKASGESEFKNVFSFTYVSDKQRISDLLGIPVDTGVKDVKGYKVEEGFGVRDFTSRKPAMMIFGIYNPVIAMLLGSGYEDCSVNEKESYEYLVEYAVGSTTTRFPPTPIKIAHQNIDFYPPAIKKITPGEETAKLEFFPDKSLNKKSGGAVIGYNIYQKSDGKTKKINRLLIADSGKGKGAAYVANDLKKGQEYSFFITAVSLSGKESQPGEESLYVGRSLKAPDPVQKVEVKPVAAGFEVSWGKHVDTDITGYNVYLSKSDPQHKFEKINKVLIPSEKNTYVYFTKQAARRYSFRVGAVNRSGNESAMSASAFVTYKNMEQPPPPEMAEVVPAKKGTKISWKYKETTPIKGFILYRSADMKDNAYPLDIKLRANARECTDLTALPGGHYWYSVKAISVNGVMSDYPTPKLVETPDEGLQRPPADLHYAESAEGIMLSWKASKMLSKGYNIYKTQHKGSRELLTQEVLPLTQVRFIDKGEKRKDTPILYELVLLAKDGTETKTKLTTNVPAMRIVLTPPMVQIAQNPNERTFLWTNDTDKTLSVYELYRKSEKEKTFRKIGETKGITGQLTDKSKLKGTYYYYIKKKSNFADRPISSKVMPLQI